MKRVILLQILCVFVSTISSPTNLFAANNCGGWKFALEEVEGGKQWMASVCSKGNRRDHALLITCHRARFYLRFLPATDADFTNQKRNFSIATDTELSNVRMPYEAMDGAFTVSVGLTSQLANMIRSGNGLAFVDAGGKVPAVRFSLRGSSRALDQLQKRCGR